MQLSPRTHKGATPVNVLLVNDRHENLVALEALLSGLDVNLVCAYSGREALQRLLREDFALILLDVQMPEMDGFETARLIHEREKTRHIPIIFLTAIYKTESDRARGYSVGAVDYIFKPLDPIIVRSKVGSFVELTRQRSVLQDEIRKRQNVETQLLKLNRELDRRVKERTDELETANKKLEAASRAKDQFLAILAHELRNPLAPLVNTVELWRRGALDSDGSLVDARERIERGIRQLMRLVDDLLDVARITTGKITLQREPTLLQRIVDQAVEFCRPLIEQRRHHLTISLPGTPIWIEADATRLVQVLSNLLDNAAKFTEKGGQIALIAEREAQTVVIRVRDDGAGIPTEMLERIFDVFTQVDTKLHRTQGGLGIGLGLAKRLVEMHGGSVGVISAGAGQGSEFVVRLPARIDAPDLPIPPPIPPDADQQSAGAITQRRVLVVDDNADAADALAILLRLWGHRVDVVYDGLSAVERAVADPPDVAILDIGLPQMDGYEVAKRLRAEPAMSKVLLIALTGYGQEQDRQRTVGKSGYFDHHLVKPVSPGHLGPCSPSTRRQTQTSLEVRTHVQTHTILEETRS